MLESRDNPVIVTGHTRVAAMKLLGWTEIPDDHIEYCDGLTQDEIATWNIALLKAETKKLNGAERQRTGNAYNLDICNKRVCGKYWQDNGVNVIPTLTWSLPDSYDYAFEGISQGSTVAVSTVGVLNNPDSLRLFKRGLHAALELTQPETVLLWGRGASYYSSINNSHAETVEEYLQRKAEENFMAGLNT